jgi:nucleotide-binding universal stress UspA family protein
MQTIRRVLCPVDLSEASARALRHAGALNSIVDGDLTVLHVQAAGGHQADSGKSPDASLEAFAAEVIALGPSTRLVERHGEPAAEILKAAAAGSDVIVMGTHGRTGLQRLLLGSVTERVIRRSPVPVLAVPPRTGSEPEGDIRLDTILCAVDFSEPSVRAVEYAASIAAAAGARLLLAHALEWSEEMETLPDTSGSSLPSSEDDAIARMNELISSEIRAQCAPELLVGYGAPADEVMRFVHERHVDVVVVGIRDRNAIDMAVFGSTTQRLIRGGRCAVLTVRAVTRS